MSERYFDAGIFLILDRFFLLFQQHTTMQSAFIDNDMFGPSQCYSFLRMMVRHVSFHFLKLHSWSLPLQDSSKFYSVQLRTWRPLLTGSGHLKHRELGLVWMRLTHLSEYLDSPFLANLLTHKKGIPWPKKLSWGGSHVIIATLASKWQNLRSPLVE